MVRRSNGLPRARLHSGPSDSDAGRAGVAGGLSEASIPASLFGSYADPALPVAILPWRDTVPFWKTKAFSHRSCAL